MKTSLAERFWRYVKKSDGCWEWIGALNDAGYGILGIGGRSKGSIRAHRLSWMFAHRRRAIPKGMQICHHCDNRKCVRPDHLFMGTNADNVRDMWKKGRGSPPPIHRGEKNSRTKLKPKEVREIRRLAKQGESFPQIARQFRIGLSSVHRIAKRQTWSHLS